MPLQQAPRQLAMAPQVTVRAPHQDREATRGSLRHTTRKHISQDTAVRQRPAA